jgi:hypothetical protein
MSPEAFIWVRQRIALDALTLKRAAASRQERPSDIAAQTRRRRSMEIDLAMHAGFLSPAHILNQIKAVLGISSDSIR